MADAGLEKIGVKAVTEGVDQFVKDLARMQTASTQTNQSLGGATSGASSFSSAMSGVGAGAVVVGGIVAGLALQIGSGVGAVAGAVGGIVAGLALQIGSGLVGAIQSAIGNMAQFGTKALMMAGDFQEMELAALAVGQAAGISQDQMRAAIDSVSDAGIRYDVAARATATLARNNVDLSKAVELANRAQGAAFFLNTDSSNSLDRLIQATISGGTESLKAMGIFVSFEDVYKRYAQSIDKSIESLTEQEKVQARVNAVIENSAALVDVYGAAMESPTKRLRSLTGQLLPELSAAIGAPFLSAFSTVVKAISDFVSALTQAAQEGGALYPILVQLGAIASLVADGFAGLVGVATDFINGFSTTFLDGLSSTADGALQWGAEIVAQLARGMIEGAAAALSAVMSVINSILSMWLAPGSDPKVAPLSQWGAAAMTQYLSGFSDANFDVLESIQGVLRQVLSGKDFAKVSEDMIKAMTTGKVDESFFANLAKSAGQFGNQIAELARRQFALADATAAVAVAEKKAKDARKGIETAQANVSKLTKEYNQMLRAGASKEALRAKLQEIRAAQSGLKTAQQQAAEAEKGVDDAEERAAALKEQVSLQDRLVKQLLDMAKATATVAAAAAVVKPPEAVLPTGAVLPKGGGDIDTEGLSDKIKDKINEAIDRAKDDIKAKFKELFAPIQEEFDKAMNSPEVQTFKNEFNRLLDLLYGPQVYAGKDVMGRDVFYRAGGGIIDEINKVLAKIWELGGTIAEAIPPEVWEGLEKGAGILVIGLIIAGITALITVFGLLAATVTGFIACFVGIPIAFGVVVAVIVNQWSTLQVSIATKAQGIYNSVTAKIGELRSWLSRTWDGIYRGIVEVWDNIRNSIQTKIGEIRGTIDSLIVQARDTLVGAFTTFKSYMADIFGPWLDGFRKLILLPFETALTFIQTCIDSVIGAIEELKRKLGSIHLPPALTGHSPSPFEISLRGIADAMGELSRVQIPAMSAGLRAASPAPVGASAMGGSTGAPSQQIYRQNSITFGPNYISNQMDADILYADFRRRIMSELRG